MNLLRLCVIGAGIGGLYWTAYMLDVGTEYGAIAALNYLGSCALLMWAGIGKWKNEQ